MNVKAATVTERHKMISVISNKTRLLVFLILLFAGISSLYAQTTFSTLPDAFDAKDLLWQIRLGSHQYTIPIIDNDQLFIGIDDRNI